MLGPDAVVPMNLLLCVESDSPCCVEMVGLENILKVVGPYGEESGYEQDHLVVFFLVQFS